MARTLQVESINSSSTGLDLQTLGSSRLFINSSGNVGIGTTSPSGKLYVAGSNTTSFGDRASATLVLNSASGVDANRVNSILFGGELSDTNSAAGIAFKYTDSSGKGNGAILFATRSVTTDTAPTERLRIDSSGNVGIGTTSPVSVLDISKASDTSERAIKVQNSSSDLYIGTEGASGNRFSGSSTNNVFFGTTSAAGIEFATNNTVRAKIDSSGNVGIGVAGPATKLHVQGAGTTSAFYTNGDAVNQTLYLQSSGGLSGDGGQILFGASQGAFAGIKAYITNGNGPAGDLIFQTRTTSGNVVERMRIDYSGNVGIGASPIDQLTIGGTGRINFGGSVITDTIAGIYFHTAGSTSYAIHRTSGAWTASTYQQLRMGFDTGIVLDGGTAHANSFVRVDGTGIRVATGNIGIGTTTKALSYKLEINGSNWTDCCRINASGTSSGIEFWDTPSGTLVRKGVLYTNSEGFGLLNSATSWALRVNHGTTNVVIPNGSLTVGQDVITNANYGYGLVGVYPGAADKFQSVYAMSTSYTMKADGSSLSAGAGGNNFYGIAWSHPNAGGQAANLTDHGILIATNGTTKTAISSSIWCIGNITAYSDERVKTNWRNFDNNFIEKLAKVKSGIFDRTDLSEKENGFKTQVGVSAQSLKEVIPNAVTCNSEGMLSVSYGNAAMASCVELAKEILKLKEEIAKIKENK